MPANLRPALRRGAGITVCASLLFVALDVFLRRSKLESIAIVGPSMEPALQDGDLVVGRPYSAMRRPEAGHVVLARSEQMDVDIVKRVAVIDSDDRAWLLGDNPAFSTDSRTFGPVPVANVRYRVVARYWPLRRAGRIC